jgi:hypothetical protein
MDSMKVIHDVVDVFALLVGVLGLVSLFIDPTEVTRRQRFLKIALVCTILVVGTYLAYESWQNEKDQRAYAQEVAQKQTQIIKILCAGDTNYEELYNESSAGFSDRVLNDAIDDLAQVKHVLTTSWPPISIPSLPGRPLPIRLYHIERSLCPGAS